MNDYDLHVIDYYNTTEDAYTDAWDLANSRAIHYGFWDHSVRTFRESLLRKNEIMMHMAGISANDHVLDAGCGIGGSSIFMAAQTGCKVTGINICEKHVQKARQLAVDNRVSDLVSFQTMNYNKTDFPDHSFDVVWGCESICYAIDKSDFVKEAFRLLKPGGRLVVADGFVTEFKHNEHPVIRQWLDGWEVNYLETMERFQEFMLGAGFKNIQSSDVSKQTMHSSKRLFGFYYLASAYTIARKIIFSKNAKEKQLKNIRACKFQYQGLKKRLWQFGIITGIRP